MPLPLHISRRRVLATLGMLAGNACLPGCGGSGGSGGSSPPQSTQPVPPGPMQQTSVSIGAAQAGTLPGRFIGLSYEKSALSTPDFSGANTNLIGLFETLGAGLLRIGGNSVDKTTWTANGVGQTSGQTAPPDIDALAAFLTSVDWPVLYGVNLAQSTPAVAAAEVAYVAKTLGPNLFGIEIGNEPDLYAGRYFPSTWAFADYFSLWQSFATAILAQTPDVALTGPVVASNTSWFNSFASAEGKRVSLLSAHYYRGNGQSASSTVEELVSYPDTTLQTYLSSLNAAAGAVQVPYRLAETNSFYNGGAPNVSDTYASALWVIDDVFSIALGGGVGANFHGGGNGPGYTPIADSDGAVVEARPEYYGLLLVALAGKGELLETTIAAGTLNASAYCIQNDSTQLSLIIVNKDTTNNLQFTAACPGSVESGTIRVLTGDGLSSTSGVTIQGSGVETDGTFTPQAPYSLTASGQSVAGYVPAASAALVSLMLS